MDDTNDMLDENLDDEEEGLDLALGESLDDEEAEFGLEEEEM